MEMIPTGKGDDDPLYRDQLRNVNALAIKQDGIVWTIFGIFSAVNAGLVNAVLEEERPGTMLIGIVVSLLWAAVQPRALSWLNYYDRLTLRLEQRLNIAAEVAISTDLNRDLRRQAIRGMPVRPLMGWAAMMAPVLWAIVFFATWDVQFVRR